MQYKEKKINKMKKIDDKKIKGLSIQFDMSTKLNELDGAILDFEKKNRPQT